MYLWDLVVRREKRNFIGASARDWGDSLADSSPTRRAPSLTCTCTCTCDCGLAHRRPCALQTLAHARDAAPVCVWSVPVPSACVVDTDRIRCVAHRRRLNSLRSPALCASLCLAQPHLSDHTSAPARGAPPERAAALRAPPIAGTCSGVSPVVTVCAPRPPHGACACACATHTYRCGGLQRHADQRVCHLACHRMPGAQPPLAAASCYHSAEYLRPRGRTPPA